MRHNTPSWIRRGPNTWVVLALATLPLISCYESQTITCSSGLVCPASMTCSADGKSCLADTCGDGLTQAQELCDDGNTLDGDGCSADCRSREACGDGVTDKAAFEVCDDNNTASGDGCSEDCKSNERCGNGIVDSARGEVCDDRNEQSGDGCSADCHSLEFCGNNYLDSAKGEKCDDGNNDSGDGCSGDCRSVEFCGNGYQDTAKGEACDDGNTQSGDGCSFDCKSNETCGNNITDVAKGEVCDDGDNEDGDECSANCRSGGGCGNGFEDYNEECDAGSETDQCTRECRISFCGDGYTNRAAGEDCDFRNPKDKEGCLTTCKFSRCGDGVVDNDRGEQCDDGNTGCGTCNATCTAYGFERASGAIEIEEEEWGEDWIGTRIQEGWKFSISDGRNLPVIFEFTKKKDGKEVSDNHVLVEISNGLSSYEVASKVFAAIKSKRKVLDVDASHSDGSRLIKLRRGEKGEGSFGNQRLVRVPQDESFAFFKMSGLSGGKGRDCLRGTRCESDKDCAPELKCDNDSEDDPKTCRPE